MELSFTDRLKCLRRDVEQVISIKAPFHLLAGCTASLDCPWNIVSAANDRLIDIDGYEYNYSAFTIDDLCIIADSLME